MNKIVEMIFGSKLYGTDGPNSDQDIKGIYMPTLEQMFLGKFPKSVNQSTKTDEHAKNTAADKDVEFYSLHYFIDLAMAGETVALDMLHAPKSALLESSWRWNVLTANRELFYTKNLKSLVGYARKQAAKYGVKGSRLAEAKNVMYALQETIESDGHSSTINQALYRLPEGEHCGLREGFYEVCGKKLTLTARCEHYIPTLEKFVKEYGDRARQAETNEGVDWKAVSHAFRAAFQTRAILKHGGFTYPLPETDFLRQVKTGQLHFKSEVAPALDAVMDEVEALTKASTLPEHVDRQKVEKMLLCLVVPAESELEAMKDTL